LPIAAGVAFIFAGVLLITRVIEEKGVEHRLGLRAFINPMLATLFYGNSPILKKVGVAQGGHPIVGAFITHATGLFFIVVFGRLLRVKWRWERVPLNAAVYFIASGVLQAVGSIFTFYAVAYAPAMIVAPIWNIQPLVTFALVHSTLKGIEVVTVRDGIAAALIVGGVFILSWV
jgi:uncharacterized membrane protein